ncbi:MAG: GntR family transcriptional regulator [Clostridiales bacterium]|nr:GntR family transcriptional regulator [Clostridiales bacterium]
MAVIRRMSLVDQVYEKLRDQIVSLEIPFGSKLNVSKLQEEYGVSSTPIREALNRLLNDGLIEFENNVGARVIDLTPDDVRQVQELSYAYKIVAARNALRSGDLTAMAEEINRYIEQYRHSTNVVESCRCIKDILDVFYKNANNDRLLARVTSLNGLDSILHSLFAIPREQGGSGGQYHSGIVYFEQIREAVLDSDFNRICDALEGHQLWSREYILKNMETIRNKRA